MKNLTLSLILSLLALALLAQVPQGISHQAVIRNAANELVTNATVGIRISILQESPDGTPVYAETHSPLSNANGLITFVIGQGTIESGLFTDIDWAAGPYFIKTEADPAGGSDYTIEGVTQMLSVPYALFAEKVAGSVAANIYPPTVVATEASDIESFSATFNGIVNAEGFSSTVVFEWGTTPAYGNTTTATQSPVTGSADVMVSANRSNLQSATTYHYRIRATNAVNVSYSEDMQFTTLASPPQLTTNVVTNILAFSATSGGHITYDGGSPITARGVVWSTDPEPTLDDNFTIDGDGSGSFTSEITGLTHGTTYYLRAYATNVIGTTYGNQRSFNTQNGIATLTTNAITNIMALSATSGGNITADGGTPVTARGVVWSTNPSPTLNDNFTVDGAGTGSFTSEITGLTLLTTYYVIAYATNAVGTTYGNQLSFTTYAGIPGEPCIGSETITDVEGNVYNTVAIATQCWMKENLKTTKYRNGTSIENPTGYSDWQNNTTGAYVWYNNDIAWKESYGALYNWHAVNNANGLCPTGWHVPTDAEFTAMTNHLGGTSVAGGKMKSTRTVPDPHPRWESPNTGATNESNLSWLPGGRRESSGTFNFIGTRGHGWSSTEDSATSAWVRGLLNNSSELFSFGFNAKTEGYSVRCIRD